MVLNNAVNACCPAALPTLRNCEGFAPAVQHRSVADVEELAASYERKLIEVSVFHSVVLNYIFIIAFSMRFYSFGLVYAVYFNKRSHMRFDLKW